MDLQYARVTDATIIFEGASFKKYVQTDENVAYEVELAAGSCVVRVIRQGFLTRRIKFNVGEAATRTSNVILDVEPVNMPKCPKG